MLDLKQFVHEIHQRLCVEYGCPVPYFHRMDALSELVSALLSHRTKNRDSGRAFKNLRERFATWKDVRDAPVDQVQAELRPCTWPEQKAPRLKQVLHEITARRGGLSLDFLADISVTEAREWLEKLPGVGPKTSAAVLSFSTLRRKALPVDSHHFRVASRLGIINPKIGEAKAHQVLENLLPEEFDAQQVFDNHEIMMFHGQRCCFHYRPACGRCVLLDVCPTGQALASGHSAQPPQGAISEN